MMSISAGFMAVLVMALYLNSPMVLGLYPTPSALWGVCCILLYWISRITIITHRGEMLDDPIVFAVNDKVSQICLIATLILILVGATTWS